jgi:hypothetical protein
MPLGNDGKPLAEAMVEEGLIRESEEPVEED